MNAHVTTQSWSHSVPFRGAGFGQRVAGFILGASFTFGLFLGIAHYEKGTPPVPAPPLDDLRVALQQLDAPPPLPVQPVESVPDPTPLPGFDLAPAASPVKMSVSPPDLGEILPEDLSRAPRAQAQLGPMLTEFKPKMDLLSDPQQIFQKSDVDRIPSVLSRDEPKVTSKMLEGRPILRITVLMVVEIDGSVKNIRITKNSEVPAFDALMIESIKEWVFSPAIKRGNKVRCLMEQTISVRLSSGSRFGI